MLATLEEARKAVESGDDAAALEALLTAWRSTRSPRVADAIDGVSARLLGSSKGVTARSVKARTEAWLDLADKASPRDIAVLLATPWPGKWKDGLPWLSALIALPHDPRIAMALARLLESPPWADSATSSDFTGPLLRHLGVLRDVRVVPILESDLAVGKSRFWRLHTAPIVAEVAATLASMSVPQLSAKEEAIVARFVRDVVARAKSEAELLAAIHAAPSDDARRAVFADWLLERGDPRGEFITLQLARDLTPKMAKRMDALLQKHQRAWAGALDRLEEVRGLVFERGFLARATVRVRGEETLPPRIDNPVWATVHTLTLDSPTPRLAVELLALPALQQLRCLRGCFEVVAAQLGPRPALEELEIGLIADGYETAELLRDRKRIADGEDFPNVRRLLLPSLDAVAHFVDGGLLRRAEQLTVADEELRVGHVVRHIAKLALPALREIRVVERLRGGETDPWCISMRRDASGRFTVLHGVAFRAARGTASPDRLLRALRSIEPDDVTALSIDRQEPSSYDVETIHELEAALARFPSLTSIDVPWDRRSPASSTRSSPRA